MTSEPAHANIAASRSASRAHDFWLGAVRALTERIAPGTYHAHLTTGSFVRDASGDNVLLTDPEYITAMPPEPVQPGEALFSHLAAPEQTGLVDHRPDERSNVYSLGVLGYMLFSQQSPYPDGDRDVLSDAIARRPLPRIDHPGLEPDQTNGLNRIVARATAKDPAERYESLGELAADVALLEIGTRPPARPSGAAAGPVVGRHEVSEELRRAVQGARSKEHRGVCLFGEPGMGKTFLWKSLEAAEAREEELWFYHKSSQIAGVPFGAIGSLFDALVPMVIRPVSPSSEASASEKRLGTEAWDPRARKLLGRIATTVPAATLSDGDEPARRVLDTDRASVAYELASILADLFQALPVSVLVFDDVQWLDEQSLRVVHELLQLHPVSVAVMLIGRPAARARISDAATTRVLSLDGLAAAAARSLFDRAISASDQRIPPEVRRAAERAIEKHSRGNPLIITNIARRLAAAAAAGELAGGEPYEEGATSFSEWASEALSGDSRNDDALEALALTRLEDVSADGLELLEITSLLLPPVQAETLASVPCPVCTEATRRTAALSEAETAFLIRYDRSTGRVDFAHDTIERAVERKARRDAAAVEAAVEALLAGVSAGEDRATFGLARLLVPAAQGPNVAEDGISGRNSGEPVDVCEIVDAGRRKRVLEAAATRASELLAAADAFRYSEAALHRHRDAYDAETLLRLHEIAHEAAFFLDDVAAMSRHFQRIRARAGELRVNEARKLWITRAFGKSWFVGALRIGVLALGELDARLPLEPTEQELASARRYLRLLRFTFPAARLRAKQETSDARTALIVQICVRLFVSVLAVRPALFPILIRLILSHSFAAGRTPYTGMAFLYWAMVLANQTATGAVYFRMGRAARRYMTDRIDRPTRLTIEIATLIFTEHWGRDLREVHRELEELHFTAMRAGNIEYAVHAGHIYCVGEFFTGRPLATLFDEMDQFRTRIYEVGMLRTARALAKYQQTVESLLGRTAHPLELTGSLEHERTELESYYEEGDYLALVGTLALRGLLAVYMNRPDKALADYRLASTYEHYLTSLPDVAVMTFLRGMVAWREGAVAEAKQVSRRLRKWAAEVPANHRHRYLAVRAEKARFKGRSGRAATLYRRARARAISLNYIHEAALISERLGDLLDSGARRIGEADAAFYEAYALYSRWGAVHAAERVRARLGWTEPRSVTGKARAENDFVRRALAGESESITARGALEELSRVSAADDAYARLDLSSGPQFYAQHRGEGGDAVVRRIEPSELPAAVARRLSEAAEEPVGAETPGGAHVLVARSGSDQDAALSVVLLNKPGRPAFAAAVSARVKNLLSIAGLILGQRHLTKTAREQSADLDATRQALSSTQRNVEALFGALEEGLLLVDESETVLVYNEAAERYLASGSDGHGDDSAEAGTATRLEPELAAALSGLIVDAARRQWFAEAEVEWGERVLLCSLNGVNGACALSVRDVTELRAREREVRRQRQQLIVSDRMSSLGLMASTIAHEVGNPNHILQLNTQALFLLLDRLRAEGTRAGSTVGDAGGLLSEAESLLEQIMDGTRRVEEVVRQIKGYARSGRREEWAWVSPAEICNSAIGFSRILVSKYTDRFEYQLDADTPEVYVVRGLIEQAIVNLLKNACEALPDRKRRIRLESSYDAASTSVVISVADEGRGIPEEVLSTLGDAFVGDRAAEGGTGLGVSIVQTILEKHGGAVSFHKSEEFATIARMHLPLSGPQAEP